MASPAESEIPLSNSQYRWPENIRVKPLMLKFTCLTFLRRTRTFPSLISTFVGALWFSILLSLISWFLNAANFDQWFTFLMFLVSLDIGSFWRVSSRLGIFGCFLSYSLSLCSFFFHFFTIRESKSRPDCLPEKKKESTRLGPKANPHWHMNSIWTLVFFWVLIQQKYLYNYGYICRCISSFPKHFSFSTLPLWWLGSTL